MWGKMQLHPFGGAVQIPFLYTLPDPGVVQRIREDMTLRFQKQEVGSWKLEVGFSQLCTRSLFRTKIHESFSEPMNKVD